MAATSRPLVFWISWVLANAVGELVGLGMVGGIGYLAIAGYGELQSVSAILGVAVLMIALGGFEGWVVGSAQAAVLKTRLASVRGWVRATIFGAVAAWIIGMAPSTVISLLSLGTEQSSSSPPEISEWVRLVLAAGLGFVAGPILAVFQWRVLRLHVKRAGLWILANALAWAVGMPIIFLGAHSVSSAASTGHVVLMIAAALVLAGGAVGVIHGGFLVKMTNRPEP